MSGRPAYPDAPRVDVVDEYHGVLVPDPYRWLEDSDDPRTVEWLAQQQALMSDERASWTTRESFATRVEQLLGAGSVSPPYWRGARAFVTRREPGQQFAVLYVQEEGEERVLLDPMALDPTGLTTLDAWQPSKDGALLAYQLSVGGTEESLLHVLDVATGKALSLPCSIPLKTYEVRLIEQRVHVVED